MSKKQNQTVTPAGPRTLAEVPEYAAAQERVQELLAEYNQLESQLAQVDLYLRRPNTGTISREVADLVKGVRESAVRDNIDSTLAMQQKREQLAHQLEVHATAIAELWHDIDGSGHSPGRTMAGPGGVRKFPAVARDGGSIREAAIRQIADAYRPDIEAVTLELANVLTQAAMLNAELRGLIGELQAQRAENVFYAHHFNPVFHRLGESAFGEIKPVDAREEGKAYFVEEWLKDLRRAGLDV